MDDESSEKRRERLQAMRSAASESLSSSSSIQTLTNPLIQSESSSSPPLPHRFDYYTDPMSAFSSSAAAKKRSFSPSPIRPNSPAPHPNPGPRNYHNATPNPQAAHQFPVNQSPDGSQWGSHQIQSPFSGHYRGTPPTNSTSPSVWNRSGGGSSGPAFPPNYTARGSGFPSPVDSSGHNFPPNYSSSGGYLQSPVDSSGHNFPPNYSSRSGCLQSPSFGRGGSPRPYSNSGRGRGWHFGGNSGSPSPRPNSGRGGGWQFGGSSGSPSPGRSGGRGRGFGSNRHDPGQYYIKAMVKDPWRKLKPIVGNILVSHNWLPKSIATSKRPKVAVSQNPSKSNSSLAEYLSLALEEAGNDA